MLCAGGLKLTSTSSVKSVSFLKQMFKYWGRTKHTPEEYFLACRSNCSSRSLRFTENTIFLAQEIDEFYPTHLACSVNAACCSKQQTFTPKLKASARAKCPKPAPKSTMYWTPQSSAIRAVSWLIFSISCRFFSLIFFFVKNVCNFLCVLHWFLKLLFASVIVWKKEDLKF